MTMNNFTFLNETTLDNKSIVSSDTFQQDNVTIPEMVSLSCLFFSIGIVGIIGNTLVVYVVFSDVKMRQSNTNILIVNLALADLSILLFGVPEIAQYMLNRGWLLGPSMCKIQRTVLVTALYSSVMTLMAVCVERYIAIVFPIKAHIMCTRRRTAVVVVIIWITSVILALPTLLFNVVIGFGDTQGPVSIKFCVLVFPNDHFKKMYIAFKYTESILFYFIPLVVQIVCYIIIGKQLFVGIKELHGQNLRQSPGNTHSVKCSDTVTARRGVIKMLIVSVVLYFVSYSPHQVLLFYNTFSQQPFHQTWGFLVGVTVLAYLNSAGNPIIYCLFSERYRRKFKAIFICGKTELTANDTMLMQSSGQPTEYTLLYRKSTKRFNNTLK